MYMIVECPKHQKALVYWKDTATHKLFKCPECDYVDYPGVVHPDLPEKYNNLTEQIKELEAEIQAYKNCSKDHKDKCPDIKCWVQILRDEHMDEIEQKTERIKELKTEMQNVANQLMDLYNECADSTEPKVYGPILGLHERLEKFLKG